MENFLMITTIANPDMLEDALRAILDAGVTGSTVISGRVYSMSAGERVKDEFGVAGHIGELIGLTSKDGRAILTIAEGGKLESLQRAVSASMEKFAGKKGFGYTISILPLATVAGLPESE